MVYKRNGGLIDVGYLSEPTARNAWIQSALSAENQIRVVLRACKMQELGPRRMPPAVFIWDLGDGGFPSYLELKELRERLPGEPALLVIGDDPAIGDWIADYPEPWGWLAEDPTVEQLLSGVFGLAYGLIVLDQAGNDLQRATRMRNVSNGANMRADGTEVPYPELSARERETLGLLAAGKTNRQIAAELGISENTVKYHVAGLYEKLGVTNRTEALVQAVRAGFLAL